MLVVPYKGKTWVPPEALFYAATGLMGFTGGRGCCLLLTPLPLMTRGTHAWVKG
jgi:hypothetical protein